MNFLCSRFVCSGEKNATIVGIETIRNLQAGEEITVCYSEIYFDDNNKNCRCFSCRAQQSIESEECPKSSPKLFGSSTPTRFLVSDYFHRKVHLPNFTLTSIRLESNIIILSFTMS